MTLPEQQQPTGQLRVPGKPSYVRGAARSVARLKQLGFDPIGELVETYNELKKEVKRQNDIRDGLIVELRTDGKAKAYVLERHLAVYDRMIKIGEDLLAYGYGKMPTVNINENNNKAPLIINLQKKGEQFVIGERPQSSEDDFDDNIINM